ncbi:hypothetical protein LCGC14_2462740, partial [marine sediment metagenome]
DHIGETGYKAEEYFEKGKKKERRKNKKRMVS